MNKPYIDFIVTHYNEPWNIGRKFFLMLSMQRNVDFDKINVIIVQDGEEGALDWDSIFESCPYNVSVVQIPHSGIPAARNAGLRRATADWVMFCDFDDMFSDVYSLFMILNVLPTNEADILWTSCYQEQKQRATGNFINCLEENFTCTYGKLYRLETLKKYDIMFNESLKDHYESAFNTIALEIVAPNRTLKITSKFNMYIKTLRTNSYSMALDTLAERMEDLYYADVYVADEFKKRNDTNKYKLSVAETIYDMYFLLNSKPSVPHHDEILRMFTAFYRQNKSAFLNTNDIEKEIVLRNTHNKLISFVQDLFTKYQIETETPPDAKKNIDSWLNNLERSSENIVENNPVVVEKPREIKNAVSASERAVVYCGTRNTYENILASLKSLLYHTKVDRVYILIEDDTFPYEIPECVTVMNVSGQKFFPENSPNYKNSWSYMCMMRAAFPILLPNVSKALSLDIDIVVTKDISELWDMDISDCYYAGVKETARQAPDYCNFGVIMMNLDKMRQDGIDNKVINILNADRQQCPEQDAFNKICAGHIMLLPSAYNYTPFSHLTDDTEDYYIIHYAGINYWKNFSPVRLYSSMEWSEIMHAKLRNAAPRIAVYCGTRNTYSKMASAAKSLLYHTPVDKIYFLIEDDTFPEKLPDCIECVNVSDQPYFKKDGPNFDNNWTYMVLMRAALSELFPDVGRILSLDNDTIVNGDISAIWDTDVSDSYFAAVPETNNDRVDNNYCNFGVVLLNLAKLRSDNMTERIINALNTEKYAYNEQDCMNHYCAGHITYLPPEYNESIVTEHTPSPLITHYAGPYSRKIEFNHDIKKYSQLSWKDIAKRRDQ